jgi:hypothetical protein
MALPSELRHPGAAACVPPSDVCAASWTSVSSRMPSASWSTAWPVRIYLPLPAPRHGAATVQATRRRSSGPECAASSSSHTCFPVADDVQFTDRQTRFPWLAIGHSAAPCLLGGKEFPTTFPYSLPESEDIFQGNFRGDGVHSVRQTVRPGCLSAPDQSA